MTTTEIACPVATLDCVFDCAADTLARGSFRGFSPGDAANAALTDALEAGDHRQAVGFDVVAQEMRLQDAWSFATTDDRRKWERLFRRIARNLRAGKYVLTAVAS